MSLICEAALREALADIEAQRSQDQKKTLIFLLSIANYDEMKSWLVDGLKADVRKKGFVLRA